MQEEQQHSLGLSLLPEAAFGAALLPQVLPRNKVSIPLARPEEPLPSADPSGAAIPPLSLPPLQTPTPVRSGAFSHVQPTSRTYEKGTDKQAFNSITVSFQNHDYIPCPTQGSLRDFQQPSSSSSRECWNCPTRPASLFVIHAGERVAGEKVKQASRSQKTRPESSVPLSLRAACLLGFTLLSDAVHTGLAQVLVWLRQAW